MGTSINDGTTNLYVIFTTFSRNDLKTSHFRVIHGNPYLWTHPNGISSLVCPVLEDLPSKDTGSSMPGDDKAETQSHQILTYLVAPDSDAEDGKSVSD